jgi:crossover junction endodeoxyribonuclease RuvC
MTILGIDPGTAVTGYGVVKAAGNTVSWVDCGVIATVASMPLYRRLKTIYEGVRAKIEAHSPDRVSIEEAFYGKNVQTTLVLGHARGVIMLAAAQSGCEISEYSPREIKKSVTGNGNAAKEQVEYMVKMLLKPPVDGMKQDAYDALAAAVCDFHNIGRASILSAAKNNR